MLRMTHEGFVSSTDPYGRPWKSIKNRVGQPLIDTGSLKNSISAKVVGSNIELESSIPYASVHQDGATIFAKNNGFMVFQVMGNTVFAKRVDISARPFLPTSGNFPKKWTDRIESEISNRVEFGIK